MPAYASPGVYFESADQASPEIFSIRTDVAAFIGIAQMGPLHTPTAVTTGQQFQSTFGGFLPNAFLAYSAKAFFENGGKKLYVVRVAAPSATATSVGPQPSDGSASLVSSVTGFAVGAVAQASQTLTAHATGAQPADRTFSMVDTVTGFIEGTIVQVQQGSLQFWRTVASSDSVAKRLVWDSPLEATLNLANPITFRASATQDLLISGIDGGSLKVSWANTINGSFDLSQPIDFASGASASSGLFYGVDGNPTLQIDAASPGIWGDQLQVSVSRSSLAATVTSGSQPTGGLVSIVDSVTGFPVASLVRLYQAGPPAVEAYRVVKSVDATINLIEWDTPLAPEFDVTKDLSLETVEFSLVVSLNGSPKEIFTGLSLLPAHPKFVENTVVSSNITTTVLPGAGPLSQRIPDPEAPQLQEGALSLSGGRDGIAALTAIDFTGDSASGSKSGLRTLENVDEVSIIAVPDVMIQPSPAVLRAPLPPPPVEPCCGKPGSISSFAPSPAFAIEAAPIFSTDSIYRVQQAVVEHCEAMQFRFAVLDPPCTAPDSVQIELAQVQNWRQRFDTEFAALYFPWVLVRDPLQLANRLVRRVPPSGHVAGCYANSDLTVGVHNAPANMPLSWAQSLTLDITDNVRGVLNPLGVDCLTAFPGRGLRVYGARTMSSDPAWRFVNVRRLVSMVEHALLISLQWCVFEPNNTLLWNAIQFATSNFLESVWRAGGLAGNTAQDAFYVKCDGTNNTSDTLQAGELIIEIGVAPVIPAEFVIFRIGRTEDTLELTEL